MHGKRIRIPPMSIIVPCGSRESLAGILDPLNAFIIDHAFPERSEPVLIQELV